MLALILFAGVIPTVIDVEQMPRGAAARPLHPVVIREWPAWPPARTMGASASPALTAAYKQMADFANRSLYSMQDVERVIRDIKAGRATSSDLDLAARAAEAATQDERDALMGLILLPEIRSDKNVNTAWRLAQLAALSKIKAVQALEGAEPGVIQWQQPGYLASVRTARSQTEEALAAIRRAFAESRPGSVPPSHGPAN